MAEARSTFPLRLRDDRLRALVREVAACEGVSQNELVQQGQMAPGSDALGAVTAFRSGGR